MKLCLWLVLASHLVIGCSTFGGRGNSAAVKKGNALFAFRLTEGDPPAFAVRKISGGRVEVDFVGGRRSIQFEEPVSSEDRWPLGSNVKPMTSYLIGLLIDQGRLTFDARLSQVLPEALQRRSPAGKIRVRDLLAHRAGLPELHELKDKKAWAEGLSAREPTRRQREKLVRAILREKPRFIAGKQYKYSNTAYLILGELVEKLTQQSWERAMAEMVFKPLGMSGCGFESATVRGTSPPDQPWGHSESQNRLISIQPFAVVDETADHFSTVGPSRVIHCDFDSWAKFLTEMLDASAGRSSLLKAETAQALFSEANDGVALGGWGAKRRDWANGMTYAMSGGDDMSYALFVIAPSTSTIIMAAANSGTEKATQVLTGAVKALTE